jgi:hypothetical protein
MRLGLNENDYQYQIELRSMHKAGCVTASPSAEKADFRIGFAALPVGLAGAASNPLVRAQGAPRVSMLSGQCAMASPLRRAT